MAQKIPSKHPVFFVMVFMLILIAVFVGYQALMGVFIMKPATKIPSTKPQDAASPSPTRGPMPPVSQMTPTFDKVVQVTITPNGFTPSTATVNLKDLVTFENTDTVRHTLIIGEKKLDVLVDGMTAYRFDKPGTYTVKDTNSSYTLSLIVR